MRHRRHGFAIAMLAAMLAAVDARGATLLVTTTADAGAGSLRQAILDANADAAADTIAFAIPTSGIPQIVPATSLPAVTQPATLDATTQAPAGRVELSGAGTLTLGLVLSGAGITVRGFVVNGFTTAQIKITGHDDVVEGNFVGTDATGTASATPATASGIALASAAGNRIGGWDAATRNLVSGNGIGVYVTGTGAAPNVVVGNWIGTDATGLAPLPNAGAGIDSFLASAQTIGGLLPGAGNVVAGNASDGLAVSGTDWVIQGNLVGVAADGATPLPNGRHGIRLFNTAARTLVGGVAPNHVAYNESAGILLAINASTGNALRANVIHDNGALGIDISGSGVTPNDAGDADTGSNLGQNFPVLDPTFAGGATIDGTLESTANATFTVELFANAACDPTGYGEGAELVGTVAVATDAGGHAAFTAALSRAVLPSEFVTATATDAAGDTSEFSLCAPSPLGTTTTSSSTSTTTTTTAVPSTTTSSTTAPTTSSSTSTSPPTTSSTLAASTTTSTSLAPSTTTSTSDPPTTTTTTEPPTTSTTAVASTTTTSSTAPTSSSTSTSPPTTSSTLAVSTTTSTSLAPSTTTSTSDPPTTTTTTEPPPTSTTTAPPTTSTTDPAPTTTSSTLAPASTTTSTSAPASTTTSTSAPPPTSTTSTTDPPATSTTTSTMGDSTTTTAPPESTTTTTGAPTTSTTTEPDAGSTTTTTSAPTTTTTLPEPPTTSTTSTAPPSTTTTSTTIAATTTSSTTPSTGTPTTSSTTTSSSSSSTTTGASGTTSTSTTLPDEGCGTALAFEPLGCRLDGLASSIESAPALAGMREPLDRHVAKARRLLDRAALRCRSAKRMPARRSLRMVGRRLAALGRALDGPAARRKVPRSVGEPLATDAIRLGGDARALARALACPQ